jgi:hypothetical protein
MNNENIITTYTNNHTILVEKSRSVIFAISTKATPNVAGRGGGIRV